MMFAKMVLLSIRRRKKEIGFVSLVTFAAVFFLAGVSLFQNVMNRYVIENNYMNYGEWVFASLNEELSHPYFASTGSCDTGAVILNEKGEVIGESIGCIDEGFLGFANLTFYEGRLPEQDDEIVMNLTTLAKLGYSLDLGQTIHLEVQIVNEVLENEEVLYETKTFEKDFTLVGTIRDFSTTWKYVDGYPLPSCVMTEQAVKELGGSLYTTHFYQLDRVYENINKEELKNGFLEEENVVFNEYVYDKVVWGSQEMFADMQMLIRLIAVLMLSYLMMSYVAKRRSWYYKLRAAGAGRSQIWAMIFIEGLYGTLPWAMLGFVIPHIIGAAACAYVSKKLALPSIFVIDMTGLLTEILSVAGIIVFVLLTTCLSTSDKRLSNNVAEVTKGQLWRLKLVSRGIGKRNVAKKFLKRQNVRNPLQRIAMVICTLAVSAVLISCVGVIRNQYEYYELVSGNRSDFTAYKYEMVDGNTYILLEEHWTGELVEKEMMFTSGMTLYKYDDGINSQLDAEINAIEGIARREESIFDNLSKLDWETKRESQIYLREYERKKDTNFISEEERWRCVDEDVHYLVRMDTYEDLKKEFPLVFERAKIDEAAFRSGEQIIVVCPEVEDFYVNEEGEMVEDTIQDTTLTDGTQAVWVNSYIGIEVPVEICRSEVAFEELADMDILVGPYMVFASTGVAERVTKVLGTQMEYSYLEIDFEPNTAFGSTTKRLASALVAHGFEYDLGWETKAMAREEFYKALCVYGTLFCVIAITYFVLQMNVQQMKHYNREVQYLQMKRLGMSDAFFLWMHVKQAVKDGLWLIPGLVIGYGFSVAVEHSYIFEVSEDFWFSVDSNVLGENTSETFWILVEFMKEELTIEKMGLMAGVLLVLLAVSVLISTCTAAKAVRKSEYI